MYEYKDAVVLTLSSIAAIGFISSGVCTYLFCKKGLFADGDERDTSAIFGIGVATTASIAIAVAAAFSALSLWYLWK